MSKILFNGFYGFENTGDDAFVEIASWGNRFYWKNEEPAYFTGNKLPEVLNPIKKIYPAEAGKVLQKTSTFKHALNSDYFISAGGSIFSEIRPFGDIAFAEKAGLLNKKLKYGAIGVSLGPFLSSQDEKRVEKYLQKLNFLALRDTESYEYAMSLKLNCKPVKAFDLAALLPVCYESFPEPLKNENYKTIGISVCNYERYIQGDLKNEERRNKFLKEVIQSLSKNKNYRFKFFIFNGNQIIGDKQLTDEMTISLYDDQFEIIPYSGNTLTTWKDIKSCDFMLSTRLHASIFACYAQVPFMLVEYHRKCNDFLNDIGYEKSARIFDGERKVTEVVFDIENFLNGKYIAPTHVNSTIERAKLNFTEIRL